jgi:hypothetical protein
MGESKRAAQCPLGKSHGARGRHLQRVKNKVKVLLLAATHLWLGEAETERYR